MTSTKLSGEKVMSSGYSVPNVITTPADLDKFRSIVLNGGKYAGKQVISPDAAELFIKQGIFMDRCSF